jgi:hypothetical protein
MAIINAHLLIYWEQWSQNMQFGAKKPQILIVFNEKLTISLFLLTK